LNEEARVQVKHCRGTQDDSLPYVFIRGNTGNESDEGIGHAKGEKNDAHEGEEGCDVGDETNHEVRNDGED